MANPDLTDEQLKRLQKPPKGTHLIERRTRTRTRKATVEDQKEIARKRDAVCPNRCRLPHCPYCKLVANVVSQVAHVKQAMGIGGDPKGVRSDASGLMLLCPLAHAAQENHDWTYEPLTDAGTAGPCEFYVLEDVYDRVTGEFSTLRLLWARERAIGIPEHPFPLVRKRKPARRAQSHD